ncbi:hypothetical protein Pan241w_57900 [Gimesia alba]|uniref:Uncharacterized protein n=1 Tax=Gimesia alba TaxID=2527973 RepID=A0A517RP44_9PLAN|nr:hypothetical protein Pan241w_57900 [Gimesia alba]
MRQLLFKGALVAPLLMGMAVLGFGNSPGDIRLPGREVNSIEASMLKGGACGGYVSNDCIACTGKRAKLSGGGGKSTSTGGGCASTCSSNTATNACSGG